MCISRNMSLSSYYKEIFQTELVERIKTHVLYSVYIFFENGAIFYVEKFGRARHATDNNTTNALYVLDN